MAEAPPPTYDVHGNLALGWLLVVRYEPSDEAVVMSWNKDGDLFRRTKQGAVGYLPDDLEDLAEDLLRTLRMLASPTLF